MKGGRVIGRISRQTDDTGAIKQRPEVDAIKEEKKKLVHLRKQRKMMENVCS